MRALRHWSVLLGVGRGAGAASSLAAKNITSRVSSWPPMRRRRVIRMFGSSVIRGSKSDEDARGDSFRLKDAESWVFAARRS